VLEAIDDLNKYKFSCLLCLISIKIVILETKQVKKRAQLFDSYFGWA